MPLDPKLLEILCCPAEHVGEPCRGDIVETKRGLHCQKCGLMYPVEDGIPVMLQDHAKRVVR